MFTLLIIDDNALDSYALGLALRNEPYHIYSAQNSTEAFALAQKIKPDLILLDVNMPDRNGFEICREFKSIKETAEIPIIFLSAMDEDIIRVKGLNEGGEDYITKPFSPEELLARIRIRLASRARQKELEHLRTQDQHYFSRQKTMREELLDQMQHDLKNPLACIKTSTHLINQYSLNQPARILAYTQRIDHAVDETIHLIERLLEMVKSETGRNPQFEMVEIEPFIQRISQVYKALAETNKLQFTVRLWVKSGAKAYFDPAQMQSVIGNLLSNALKYTQTNGKILLQVSLENQALRIEVTDSGRGISEQHIDKIFNRLYRVPDNYAPVAGTGLGLYIVKSIVEQHGGMIEVRSALKQGSTFVVSIPQNTSRKSRCGSSEETVLDRTWEIARRLG